MKTFGLVDKARALLTPRKINGVAFDGTADITITSAVTSVAGLAGVIGAAALIDALTDGTTNKVYSATEKTKLAGIATGATANSAESSSATASTLVVRDTNANAFADKFVATKQTQATASGDVVLTSNSAAVQEFTGTSASCNCNLPSTGITEGEVITFMNATSSGTVTVRGPDSVGIIGLQANRVMTFIAKQDTPTLSTHWQIGQMLISYAAAVNTLAGRDGNANMFADNYFITKTTTPSSGGIITMTIADTGVQQITGTLAHTIKMPTTGWTAGTPVLVINNSTLNLTVQASDASAIYTMTTNRTMMLIPRIDTPVVGGDWAIAWVTGSTAASVNTGAVRDGQGAITANTLIPNSTALATAAGTSALALSSAQAQIATGSTAGRIYTLPTTSVPQAFPVEIQNPSTVAITVNASAGALVAVIQPGGSLKLQTNQATPTTPAHWTVMGGWNWNTKVTEYTNSSTSATVAASGVAIPTGALGVKLTIIPPGPGGGSGRRGAAGTARGGGGGGCGAPVVRDHFIPIPASTTTYAYSLGVVGAGGAAQTADNNDGFGAANIGACTFNLTGGTAIGTSSTALLSGFPGTTVGGAGGNPSVLAAPTVNASLFVMGGQGGSTASPPVGNAGQDAWVPSNAPGGGGGGGINASDVAGNGGNSGAFRSTGNTFSAGGVVDTTVPATPLASNATAVPGQGGPGGAASKTAAAQAGANGVGYGAPGGGGGASLNGFNSGKGGDGGPAYMRLEWVYA